MLYLIIKNRDKVVFEGNVNTVSSYNKSGLFNILSDHSNFISIIEKKIVINQGGATEEMDISNGLLKVKDNKIWIYLGIK
jgi:F0F1-type ATP synthase epsilon subunit